MPAPPAVVKPGIWIVLAVLAAILVSAVAVWRSDPWGGQGNRLSERFDYELSDHQRIDPALVLCKQVQEVPIELEEPRAVAVGPDDRIYIAGDKAVVAVSSEGAPGARIDLEDAPRCLTLTTAEKGSPLYVGMKDHVEVYDASGSRLAAWPGFGAKALLTSIAVGESDVFVADAGNRIVWRCDPSGKVVKQIGKRDEDRHIRGFVIPSPYFDLAVTPDGLVRVVNPGMHRVEGYTVDGDLEVFWGKPSLAIEGFCGCCNPANFAVLPDGSFVTVEKGVPRVKIYDPEGQFVGVVAGPEQLTSTPTITQETRAEHKLDVLDVAVDGRGRIVVLDPSARRLRIFERLPNPAQEKTEAKDE